MLGIITLVVIVLLGVSVVKANVVQIKMGFSIWIARWAESLKDYPTAQSPEAEFAETIPILVYHGINPKISQFTMSKDRFREQLTALYVNGYQTVTLEDFIAFMNETKKLPARSFLLTFDDGRKDSYYDADPILKRLGYNAVMFIATSQSLGKDNLFSSYYLNSLEVKEMVATGRWEIGSHARQVSGGLIPIDGEGTSGYFLSNKQWLKIANRLESDEEYEERVKQELTVAPKLIADLLNLPVKAFSYPFSDYGQQSVNNKELAETVIGKYIHANYSLAFQQQWAYDESFVGNHPSDDPHHLKRIEPAPTWSGEFLSRFLLSGEDILPIALGQVQVLGNAPDRWRLAWGKSGLTAGRVILETAAGQPSTFVTLDGSRSWRDYRFDVKVKLGQGLGSGAVAVYADLKNMGDSIRCVWMGKVLAIEQKINNQIQKRLIFSIATAPGTHTFSVVSRPGVIGCLQDGIIVGAFPRENTAEGGVSLELWSPGKAITAEIINLAVTFPPTISAALLKKQAALYARPLSLNITDQALKQKLKSDYNPPRRYLEVNDSVLPVELFQTEVWGGEVANFSSEQSTRRFSVDLIAHLAGSAYWRWPVQLALAGEYQIKAKYTASVSSEVIVRSELKDGSVNWGLVQTLPPVAASTEYTLIVELPKNVVNFDVMQVIKEPVALTISEPSLRPLLDGSFDRGYVTLSFDDGFSTFKTGAEPLLKKFNWPATLAVITGYTSFERYLTPIDLLEASQRGHEITVHTRHHARLDVINGFSELLQEIAGAKYDLDQAGFQPRVFVYPYGDFSNETVSLVRRSGFIGARSVRRGLNTKNTDPFYLKDKLVGREVAIEEIKSWLKQAAEDKRWLILEFHNVYAVNNPSDSESVTTQRLQEILSLIKGEGLEVITLEQGLQKMAS